MDGMFLINEVAQLHMISKKTLLYYDKIGLLKPHSIDEKSGYRYYHRSQFPRLKQIIYLKDMGFNLDEIADMLNHRTFEVAIKALKERRMMVEENIAALNHTQKSIDYLIDFYQQALCIDERDLYKPGIVIMHEQRVIFEYCENEGSRQEVMLAYRKVLRNLKELNIFSQMDYGTIYALQGLTSGTMKQHTGSFIMLPDYIHLDSEYTLTSGKYAYMYKKGGYYDEKSVKIFMDWLSEQGYRMSDHMFDFCIIDYTFTKDEDEMIQKLLVKIE